uniref:LSM domain-containing protein n=1 Tax=Populus trichocarpa TaxID=3694 RepID=A9PAF4_POPTR|nr:unknown [Populus trichocarpa]
MVTQDLFFGDRSDAQLSVRNCFIRGSVVRYVQLPPEGVDVDLLHDATRREARGG